MYNEEDTVRICQPFSVVQADAEVHGGFTLEVSRVVQRLKVIHVTAAGSNVVEIL